MVAWLPEMQSLPFAELVAASSVVAATRSRTAKVSALVALLRKCTDDELPIAIGLLTGTPRQGRIGVGWATLAAVRPVNEDAPGGPSVMEVDETITLLMKTVGAGSVAGRQHLLVDLLVNCSADEVDFLHRLFLGDLRQGALEGLMIDAVAKALDVDAAALRRARTLAGDLGELARQVRVDGPDVLARTAVIVGRALEPMLAAASASVAEALNEVGTASIEWKLDGARVQVHKQRDSVWLFTRNLNDVTSRLPEVVETVRALPTEAFVADGEVLGMREDDRPIRFQDTMSRFGTDDAAVAAQSGKGSLRLYLFDLLHLDGVDLIDRRLDERRAALVRVAPHLVVRGVLTSDVAEAQAVSDEALALGHEGVMVKAADSLYEAGRRGKSWRKVKPVRTLDVVVLAAEWGHGRRQGWLSNLHLGALGPPADDGSPTFVMIGKTFKGLTDAVLTWQTEQLLAREVSRSGITVRVRPELVVEIALDGVQVSKTYPGGVALRFARVKGYRPDRTAASADSIESVRALL